MHRVFHINVVPIEVGFNQTQTIDFVCGCNCSNMMAILVRVYCRKSINVREDKTKVTGSFFRMRKITVRVYDILWGRTKIFTQMCLLVVFVLKRINA